MKAGVAVFGVALVACSAQLGCTAERENAAPEPQQPEVAVAEFGLRTLPSCADVETMVRESALQAMNQALDEQLEAALSTTDDFYNCRMVYEYDMVYSALPNAGAVPSTAPSGTIDAAKQVSTTNNQVAGVDEADFVKNDDKYIYVVREGALHIIEAWPPQSAHELAQIAVPGQARKLFVVGDRALVYSSVPRPVDSPAPVQSYDSYNALSSSRSANECTYGYNCELTGDGNPTVISVIDLRDRVAPHLVRQLHLSGSLLAARRVDTATFSVLSSPAVPFPGLRYYPENLGGCGEPMPAEVEIRLAFETLRQANRKLIATQPLADYLPTIEDVNFGENGEQSQRTIDGCAGFLRSQLTDGAQFTTVLGLDMLDDDEQLHVSTIVSHPGAVYASAQALFISVPHQRQLGCVWYSSMDQVEQLSTVHRFALDPERADVRYTASGAVKGRVLNQFAMDEYEGLLRIATTTGHVPDPEVHSTLTVLEPQGAKLEILGQLDQLAPSEDIRSVRFDGERAFLVTFKKTDPLFVIDLAQPKVPRVLAELKIPGFSTYMHLMDDQHLLTIGYDADDQGSFAWFQGVLLQIFDVSDPKNPVLAHRELIGTRGSSSEALTNHLAFNYFAPKHLLALPMTICEESAGGGSYGDVMTFSGLLVYDVTVEDGFHLRGRVAHDPGAGVTCGNWWTDATSQVKRSIVMDDYVYSLSLERLKVNALDALSTDLRDIAIEAAP